MGVRRLMMAEPNGVLWTPLNLPVLPIILSDHLSMMTHNGATPDRVSAWSDHSGAGNNFAQASSTNYPLYTGNDINTYPTVSGNGTNNYFLYNPATTSFKNVSCIYAFMVYRTLAVSANPQCMLYISTTAAGNARFYVGNNTTSGANRPELRIRAADGDSVAVLAGPSSLNDGNFHMVLFVMDYSTKIGYIYIDGNSPITGTGMGSTTVTSNTNSNKVQLLASNGLNLSNSRIASTVVGTALPSSTNIDKFFGYYATWFNLRGNLPVGHPYKTSAPTV